MTAVLPETGNWQQLRGWKNLSNGEVVVCGELRAADYLRLTATLVIAFSLWRGALAGNGTSVLSSLLLTLCGLMALALLRQQWGSVQVRRLLSRD
ncbi:hypothetical protein [Pelomonas cellulosilytica]|uniref:DUF202 domain-containing protein n=1 Tax=Pelomonas cellulosilytica TaxID=2906762 RepID=A0ABS8XXW5_9BURK|nr:hypothetical protein [Pelomonas sp. P8]MCE4555553.1 hypothetical protein [Pelomonas sp. P8]